MPVAIKRVYETPLPCRRRACILVDLPVASWAHSRNAPQSTSGCSELAPLE